MQGAIAESNAGSSCRGAEAFPAIGTPETPILRLTRGQAYSGLRRDVYNDERSGVGTIKDAQRKVTLLYPCASS